MLVSEEEVPLKPPTDTGTDLDTLSSISDRVELFVDGIIIESIGAAVANVAAIQAAITALPTTGGVIRLPNGRIYCDGVITIPLDKYVEIKGSGPSRPGGAGWGTVLIRTSTSTSEMINGIGTTTTMTDRPFLTLRNLGINGNTRAFPMVRLARISHLRIDDVRFSNGGREALILTQCWNGSITNSYIMSSGDLGSATPAVRMDSATGEEGSNALFWSNVQWEGNNYVALRVTAAAGQYAIVIKFDECKWEDATAATYPIIELLRVNAISIVDPWVMRGRKLTDLKATGPSIRVVGPVNTADEEKRGNAILGGHISCWGDTSTFTCAVEHTDGPLIVDNVSFTGNPSVAYIDVNSAVGQDDSIIGKNHYERPDKAVRDQRTTRRTNAENGRVGSFAPSATGWTGSAQALTANNGRISRYVPSRPMRIKGIGFNVQVAASVNDNFDVGIYDSTLAKIVSSGATAGTLNSTGKKRINITETALTPGQAYYIAGSMGALGGTAAQLAGANFTQVSIASFFGTTAGLVEADAAATIHPLGATITPAGGSTAGFLFYLHED